MPKKSTSSSSKKKKSPRLALFIDGNNFRNGLLALFNDDHLHWDAFLNALERDYKIEYVRYYIGKLNKALFTTEQVEKQKRLLTHLKKYGIDIWLGYFNENRQEKGVDVQIALDLAVGALKNEYDVALLITGDGDLANAVKVAQDSKKRVILGYIAGLSENRYRISQSIKNAVDSSTALNRQVMHAHQVYNSTQPSSKTKKKSTKAELDNTMSSEVLVFCDGASRGNPGPAGCGTVITRKDGTKLRTASLYLKTTTNNQAEYQGLLLGLREAMKLQPEKITCYLDSQLVVNQVNGKWKVKHPDLKPLHKLVSEFLKIKPNTQFFYIPRKKNSDADALANLAIDRANINK